MPSEKTFESIIANHFRQDSAYRVVRERGTHDCLLIYTNGGSGCFRRKNHSPLLTYEGDVTVYHPNCFQDYGTNPEVSHWDLMWSHFVPRAPKELWEYFPEAIPGLSHVRMENLEIRSRLVSAFQRLVEYHRLRLPTSLELTYNALEEALLWAHLANTDNPVNQYDPRIFHAVRLLSTQYSRPFSLSWLAQEVGLSVSRLCHLFKEQTSRTPQQMLEQNRVRAAGQMLRVTSLTIAEIASEVGYSDPYYFSKRFRALTMKSPTEYRQSKSHISDS